MMKQSNCAASFACAGGRFAASLHPISRQYARLLARRQFIPQTTSHHPNIRQNIGAKSGG
ncbi:hypothetical protein [Nitrosospira lacus]|nr:hypothetical protein [Nitrosospira lacus]